MDGERALELAGFAHELAEDLHNLDVTLVATTADGDFVRVKFRINY